MAVSQRVFIKIDVFMRNTFAQSFFDVVAYSRTDTGSNNAQQRGPNHSECDQWSNTRHDETCYSETCCRTTRSSHRTTHSGVFSVGDWYTRLESFRAISGPDDAYSLFGYTKIS